MIDLKGLSYTEYINKERDEAVRVVEDKVKGLESLEEEIIDMLKERGENKELLEYISRVRGQKEKVKEELQSVRHKMSVDFHLSSIARELDQVEEYNEFVVGYRLITKEIHDSLVKAAKLYNKHIKLGACQSSFLAPGIEMLNGLISSLNNDFICKGYHKKDKSKLELEFKNRLIELEIENEDSNIEDIQNKFKQIVKE